MGLIFNNPKELREINGWQELLSSGELIVSPYDNYIETTARHIEEPQLPAPKAPHEV